MRSRTIGQCASDFGDADGYVRALAVAFELGPDFAVFMRRVYETCPWGWVVLTGSTGTTNSGSLFENTVVSVVVWNPDGLVTMIGLYEPEHADAAVARLHELAP